MEGKGGGVAVGEVRRAHIIYFLSRKGRIEQPHLVRVHHLSRNGIHLRDVKRWLSDLRGKDMPNSFSWSYKRKYKRGFVWQDLMDDDLITPISDNEYVLKGSAIPLLLESCSCGEKQKPTVAQPEQQPLLTETPEEKPDASSCSSAITSHRYEYDSETSTSFNSGPDSIKPNEPNVEVKELKVQIPQDVEKTRLQDLFSLTPQYNKSKRSFPSTPSFNKRKNKSSSKSSSDLSCGVFRNLLNCGLVETNDTAIINQNKMMSPLSPAYNAIEVPRSMEKLGAFQNSFNGAWNKPQQQYNPRKSFNGERKPSDFVSPKNVVYKLVGKPNCSQCGKRFKPEKFHTHMKSCRGLRSLRKDPSATKVGGGSSVDKMSTSHTSTSTSFNDAKPRYSSV